MTDDEVDAVLRQFRRHYANYRRRGGRMFWPEYRNRCVDLLICVLEATDG